MNITVAPLARLLMIMEMVANMVYYSQYCLLYRVKEIALIINFKEVDYGVRG